MPLDDPSLQQEAELQASHVILYHDVAANTIVVISAGTNTRVRAVVISELIQLQSDLFQSLELHESTAIRIGNEVLSSSEIKRQIEKHGYINLSKFDRPKVASVPQLSNSLQVEASSDNPHSLTVAQATASVTEENREEDYRSYA